MIYGGRIYLVYLDGIFAGLCEEEDYIWDIAQDYTNGTPYPLTDDNFPDRVYWYTIDINRFNNSGYVVYDKLQETDNFLCYNRYEAEKSCKEMNKLNLQKERLEAKLRAMTL